MATFSLPKKIMPHRRVILVTILAISHLYGWATDDTTGQAADIAYNQAVHCIPTEKPWTVIIYMAADNDLRSFAARNIKQMAAIGSSDLVNIFVQLDIRIAGNKKITRRYYIEKNKILHVNAHDEYSQKMDSGDPQTLVSCCAWAIEKYPAKNFCLIFWNHGTGPLDPATGRIINPTELFTFNPAINKFDLDRSIGFFDYINSLNHQERGICWDDSTGNYLTNQKLDAALAEIKTKHLHGRNFSIIGFDACLMCTIEIANIIKNYADIMVGSQEVELGTGWNYQRVFAPLQSQPLSPANFAQHIVNVYGTTYSSITNDYTQSAIDLKMVDLLENNISKISLLLIECLKKQKNNTVKTAIQTARCKEFCTAFDEPSYLDLHHLYCNLQNQLASCCFYDEKAGRCLKEELLAALEQGKELIIACVIGNVVGKNLKDAHGISIYLPERSKIHYSYKRTSFAATNEWISFLNHFLAT